MAPLTVSALTRRIADRLADFGPLEVRGELSQAKVYHSGHFYATLKDADAVINLVMWRSTVVRHGPLPKEGDRVVVAGSLSVYGPRGQYQLIARRIRAAGVGDLAARFEELKTRLAAEGLFAPERKRPLPFLPRGIGLATADGSAALADLMDSIGERFPGMPVVVQPCQVQGSGAAASIAAALAALDARDDIDVIVVGRGGGSLEDLWAFNEEPVVRAIAACRLPVVAAVGHETDTTLADLVADLRAKTPTMAGELVVPVRTELTDRLAALRADLDRAMDARLHAARQRLRALAQHRALAGPEYQLAARRQRVDELGQRLSEALPPRLHQARHRLDALRRHLALLHPGRRIAEGGDRLRTWRRRLDRAADLHRRHHEERFAGLAARLAALSPLAVIARGYSVVRTADGSLVRHLDQAPPGTAIRARLADGWLEAEATGGRPQRLAEPEDLYRV